MSSKDRDHQEVYEQDFGLGLGVHALFESTMLRRRSRARVSCDSATGKLYWLRLYTRALCADLAVRACQVLSESPGLR